MAGIKLEERKIVNVGDQFEKWTVIANPISYPKGLIKVPCRCVCGIDKEVTKRFLFNGKSKSCGCSNVRYANIEIGKIYGKWRVLESAPNRKHQTYFKCECICENKTVREVRESALKSKPGSCGCKPHKNYFVTTEAAIKGMIRAHYEQIIRGNKKRAAGRGIDFDLTLGEFALIIQQPCAYSNIPPNRDVHIFSTASDFTKENGHILVHGIDRIDSTKGYELGNVVSCEHFINFGKNDKSYDQFLNWISNLILDPCKITANSNILLPLKEELTNNSAESIFPLRYYRTEKEKYPYIFIKRAIIKFYSHKKEAGKIVNLSKEDVVTLMASPCVICSRKADLDWLKLDQICNDRSRLRFILNEVDRWDNSISSYTSDNCTTLCRDCNFFKNAQTIEEVVVRIKALKKNVCNLPSTGMEFLESYTASNMIRKLLSQIENGQIVDYFNEAPILKEKLNDFSSVRVDGDVSMLE